MRSSTGLVLICALAMASALAACGGGGSSGGSQTVLGNPHPSPSPTPTLGPLSKIQHIVIIELENRSFDSYFGTYPGVNGIPPNPNCNPDPKTGQCILPWHNTSLINYGGPHSTSDMFNDIDGGKLDGFIASAESGLGFQDPSPDDVMGYHTCAEIPVYCNLAAANTLADNHFAASNTWSAIAHLYLVSAWSAKCQSSDPMSCVYSGNVTFGVDDLAWTDITYLLHKNNVSWKFYANKLSGNGQLGPYYRQNDGEEPGDSTGPGSAPATDWNPLPDFDDVKLDGELGNIVPGGDFPTDAKAGLLPSVSWITPGFADSDHPAEPISGGQTFVTDMLRALNKGPDASSTLVLLTWDEWGGFYDHVIPIQIDQGGYGFRTPLIIIGPMVKHGYIDHQLLTSDSYLKLIEDRFLGGQRLDPTTDGRPDSRPDVRETQPGLGDIVNDLGP